MMNHHLPPLPHGQPPLPPPRRQHDIPYASAPPNVRSSQAYMGYHHPHPHATGPLPPYAPHQYQQHWYPYQQMPHPPPPQPYQSYSPLIVSSYPRSQHIAATGPPPSFPLQTPTTASTPQLSSFSSTPPPIVAPSSATSDLQEDVSTNRPAEAQSKAIDGGSTSSGTALVPSAVVPEASVNERTSIEPTAREPFQPPLPWLSVPEAPFPEKLPRRRRKPRIAEVTKQSVSLSFKADSEGNEPQKPGLEAEPPLPERTATPTPTASHAPSEPTSTQPTTPSSSSNSQSPSHVRQVSQATTPRMAAPIVPIVPVVPIMPATPHLSKQGQQTTGSATDNTKPIESVQPSQSTADQQDLKATPPPRSQPKSWADLVRTKKPTSGSDDAVSTSGVGGLAPSKSESLVDVINSLASEADLYSNKIAFVEPRGLVNTGNMCYMNSVLQVLVFCVPFYDFLDRVSRRAAHSFKSELPLLDAMIMFMREFRVIGSASSVEQLRQRLKQTELEQYGSSFIPEYVYQVIRHLPRFRDMRRGHQQDAQEFLGFLFEELHEECLHAIKSSSALPEAASASDVDAVSMTDDSAGEGWLEVGHKQKAAVTRSSGHIASESPITRIFGGNLRSEFRVPGNKNSVTLEPYQSLQLDIGSPQVNNIIDALKGLTRPETMHGDFSSSRGTKVNATKQVFIESLPPVLILHLKRFHYDSVTKGTQKIWKKIGYPLELEIPKEVFAPHRRNMLAAQGGGLPKYRLTGVIYHHGKNASGGHYTVEIRRQDGREWIRIDDTVIRRVRSEDVAFAGSEEDPKSQAAALEQHKSLDSSSQSNIFRHFDQDDEQDSERGWNQVNGSGSSHASKKSVSALANGTSPPNTASGDSSGKRTSSSRLAARENKVAYLLFYQRI
ncbi:ubiquitin C-terminal hydrolase [Coccidioides immitis RS]|uniref:Ubiquitin carboxyl-terminal hydrolase n=2 Tax=Coccidioides immitis TaxID=5501 RepID=J3KLF9_COCIM|nr:ubiquitin C-terminal hydrolase [Coccidioides immitis RS]EAS37112.3 ubiquitin C-terminal hydrolase [Coccidioides immitis RS]KMP10053.1 ubiquitin C-terminal hydrolase Ubp3 [Coccidioides immitis RMSCC 2394]